MRVLQSNLCNQPPQSFQPPIPTSSSSEPRGSISAGTSSKVIRPNLITRYNLTSKIASGEAEAGSGTTTATAGAKQAWSQNKTERQALLQRRRDDMILAARRKMEAKVAAEVAEGTKEQH